MNYKLLFIGCFLDRPSFTSCDFFSKEISERFEKLPNVKVERIHFDSVDFPEADVAFVHAYSDVNAIKNLNKLKDKVKYCVYFMEEAIQSLGFDFYYHYNKTTIANNGYLLNPPVVKSYYKLEEKEPNSLLLDHDSQLFPHYNNKNYDWNEFFWEYLKKNRHKFSRIAQLGRGKVDRPDFIEVIPVMDHQSYLNATSRFENYIVTHAGSFNHTAVDMAARGIRTIVPVTPSGVWFVPEYLSKKLNLITIRNENDLNKEFDKKFELNFKLDLTVDLQDLVEKFNSDFELALSIRNKKRDFLML